MSHDMGDALRHLYVVRPYCSQDEPFVRDLFIRSGSLAERDRHDLVRLLRALQGSEWNRPPASAMICWSSASLSGFALAEAFRDMPDRWMLLCLMVDADFRKQGQATTLLRCLEREVRARGGRFLGVELPSSELWDDSGKFILKRGYTAYNGMGLAKRFPMSRYFVKDLKDAALTAASGGEKQPPQMRSSN